MASPKAVGFLLLGTVVFGYGLGSCNQPVPETRTITVTKYKTHVETRTVPAPLPDSCSQAIKLINSSTEHDGEITAAAGHILDALQDSERDLVMHDIESLNKSIQKVMDNKDLLDGAVTSNAQIKQKLALKIDQCNNDLKKAGG